MSKNQNISNKFSELVNAHLLPVLEEQINAELSFIQGLQKTMLPFVQQKAGEAQSPVIVLEHYQSFIRAQYELTKNRFTERNAQAFEEIFQDYDAACNAYIGSLRKNKKEIQKKERFYALPSDGRRVKFLKYWKRKIFQLSQLPVKILNTSRKLFKKEPLPEKKWKQIVPYRKLITLHFRDELAIKLLPIYAETQFSVAQASSAAWSIEEQIYNTCYPFLQTNILQTEEEKTPIADFNNTEIQEQLAHTIANLESLKKSFKKKVKQEIAHTLENLNEAYEKAGTLELPYRKIGKEQKKKEEERRTVYEKTTQEWSNTLFSLHEDWRIDQELNMLSVTQLQAFLHMQDKLNDKINENIIPSLTHAKQCIEGILHEIPAQNEIKKADLSGIKKRLQSGKETVDSTLVRNLLPRAVEELYKQRLPLVFTDLDKDIEEAIKKVSSERGLVGVKSYDRPIRSSEINFVSPYQIVAFESLPKFVDGIEAYQKKINKEQIKIQQQIHEIGQIAYFNLDTALSACYGEVQESQHPVEIATEGLKRAEKNIDNIAETCSNIKTEAEQRLSEGIMLFNSKLNELKNNDYALEIKFRIAKAKAIEQARAFRQKILSNIKNFFPAALALTVKSYQQGATLLKTYQKRIGIETPTEKVTSEISVFLSETEVAINRLPFVYQRLFRIQPLEDQMFYEERTQETRQLTTAFDSWKKGHYSCAVLVGEKGAGITTLINFFIKSMSKQDQAQYKILKVTPPEQIWEETHFFDFFNQIFSKNEFQSLEDIIQYINTLEEQYIIVLEHIEKMYLRKIGGFACLNLMFELISKTRKQVFWISSGTLYSWQYLDKSLHISDYFEHIIRLENIDDDKMCEVVLKRHRVSGYGITFAPPAQMSDKKLEKMSEEEQQDYLRNKYFSELNEITSGNFSLAQLFWMRSAKKVTEDTITIGSLNDLDFSFIKAISLSKTITLHLLLLHDGLKEEQYALISRQQQAESQHKHSPKARLELLQLLDDGLIIRENENYYINPLLYRPVVSLLKTKNFLH